MLEVLRETKLFRDCTHAQLERIAALGERCSHAAGEHLIEAGAPAQYLHVIERGAVELRFGLMSYGVTQEIPLDRKFRGDVIGWSAIVEPRVFTLSAVAVQDTETVRLRGIDLDALIEDPQFGGIVMRRVAETIAQRVYVLQRMLIDMAQERFGR